MFLNGHKRIPIPWEFVCGVRRHQPWTGQLNSQGICLQDTRRTPFQAYILSWTPAELDFGWMPEMNSRGMQLWHSWQLMSNRTSTKMRHVDVVFAQLHSWASNFWRYRDVPHSYDLEHILKQVPGLDLFLDVEIWNWNLSFSYLGSLYQEKSSKYILLHWKMITDQFPMIL